MGATWTTLKKELASYLYSPIAYVIAVLFYLFRGFDVHGITTVAGYYAAEKDAWSMQYMSGPSSAYMVVLVPPILTMRAFAEEKRTGSFETLMTAPVRDGQVVLGKWLAALSFYALLWLPTLLLMWVLTWPQFLATDFSFGPVVAGYVGFLLLGALLLAAGCFTSSLTDNQLLASLTSMLFGTALLATPNMARPYVGQDSPAWVRTLLEQVNVSDHLGNWFTRGLIDSGQVAFYLFGCAFFLFLTVQALGMRRWR